MVGFWCEDVVSRPRKCLQLCLKRFLVDGGGVIRERGEEAV
jgi:hypothetical protein